MIDALFFKSYIIKPRVLYTTLRFSASYFILFLVLLILEVGIAAFAHDQWIRPYVGDMLVVILLYCFARSFIQAPTTHVASVVLLFALSIEALQYVHLIRWLGLEQSLIANLILGSGFAWLDILAYAVGTGVILLLEGFEAK
jgi:hypothetical protein